MSDETREGVVYSTDTPDNTIQLEQWNTMDLNKLYDQRTVLVNRIQISNNVGNRALVTQLTKWLYYLDDIISHHS